MEIVLAGSTHNNSKPIQLNKETTVIIGAGIAGLVLANELAGHYNIVLLEAAEKPGGRIMSSRETGFHSVIEGGAEFIHGHLKQTFDLLKAAGIEAVQSAGKMYSKQKAAWKEQQLMIEGWDRLLKKMKQIRKDMTMNDFLQLYFGEDEHADLRRHAAAFAEGFDVADVKRASVKFLYREWSNEEEENFRIPAGYSMLVDYLANSCRQKGCSIFCGNPVKQVDWQTNSVTVCTDDGQEYKGTKAVITVPLGVLQNPSGKASINFSPPLDEVVKASGEIGFGAAIKIILQFKESFWKDDSGFILSNEIIPTWWTQLPDRNPVLTGWAGGTTASELSKETDGILLQKALSSLGNIFELPVQQLEKNLQAHKIFNWQKNEWALGAYSYSMPGSIAAKEILNRPVDNTLYFCGEALYEGDSPGTVEAAIVHAKETASKLVQ